jgi:hypothetical protein
MKRDFDNLNLLLARVDRRHVQIILAVVSLGLLVLGAGAPLEHGGAGG